VRLRDAGLGYVKGVAIPREMGVAVGCDLTQKSPNPTDKHVGNRVRMRRLMLDMSQTALGDALGITFQQIQKYEKGTNRISASRLQEISNILQVPISFFFEGLPNAQSKPRISQDPFQANLSQFLATSDGLSLIKAYTQIKSRAVRRAIVDLVEQIAP
jgi:transcriptional regulator with XRE-family HTH domain